METPGLTKKPSPATRRWAVLVALALLTVAAMIAFRAYNPQAPKPQSPPRDERLVWLDSDSVLRSPEDLGREMTEWFDEGRAQTLAFELSEQSFAGDTADLSSLGKGRVLEIAELMNAHSEITAVIENPIRAPTVGAKELYRERADRWREAIAAQGVDPARLAVLDKEQADPTARSSQLVVKLSRP